MRDLGLAVYWRCGDCDTWRDIWPHERPPATLSVAGTQECPTCHGPRVGVITIRTWPVESGELG